MKDLARVFEDNFSSGAFHLLSKTDLGQKGTELAAACRASIPVCA
jgi:hypothetical protein